MFVSRSQGLIHLIIGPMFSGKTSELMRLVKRFTIAERECLVLNYGLDNRYSSEGKISTHDQQHFRAVKIKDLGEVEHEVQNYDVIAIDEGQFFNDIPKYCETWANMGKIVLVAALDGTFERKPFKQILELIPLSEKVDKLTAVCWYCKQDNASFTKRTINSKEVELIGGEEMYRPSCRQCFEKDPSTIPLSKNKENVQKMCNTPSTNSKENSSVKSDTSATKAQTTPFTPEQASNQKVIH